MFQQIKKSQSNLHYFLGENKVLVNSYLNEICNEAIIDELTLQYRTIEDIDFSFSTPNAKYVIIECVDAFLTPIQQREIISKLIKKYSNAKIICGTNSAFVINSQSNALIYNVTDKGEPKVKKVKAKKVQDIPREVNPTRTRALSEEEWKNIAKMFPGCGWLIA